jgi:Ca-activated chloride channel homolog
MSTDPLAHLPEAPPPALAARDAAIGRALARFDENNLDQPAGFLRAARLSGRTAREPSHWRSAMPRMRYLVAACLACFVAAFGTVLYLRHPVAPSFRTASVSVEPAKVPQPQSRIAPAPAPSPDAAETGPRDRLPTVPVPASPPANEPNIIGSLRVDQGVGSRQVQDAAKAQKRGERVAQPHAPARPNIVGGTPQYYAIAPSSQAVPPAPGRQDRYAAGVYAPPERAGADTFGWTEPTGRDRFTGASENPFRVVREVPVSTFSLDVDTASYSFARASLNRNVLPQPASVRTEEFVNYFPYGYESPASASEPFRTTVSVFPSPWSEGRKMIRIGIKGYALPSTSRPHANLVFLIDTSGSMNAPNRLPLVKQSLALLLTQLQPRDRVAIVTYAGNAGTALESTPASERAKILGVIERLEAGGSTAGGEGIRQAYALAERNYDPAGVNRVILATDGDFNVGITSRDELKGFIERERGKGIFLSVLGFGMGNYNDAMMQALAQNGNGVAAYIDTLNEARKVLVEEATSQLFPIAKDVKIQVEFNPATVAEYRLVGYETRLLNRDDFNNDKVDAGDVGSGQSVTALYEFVPVGGPRVTGDLRYAPQASSTGESAQASEYAFLKMRYKLPKSDTSTLVSTPIDRSQEQARFEDAPLDARFAVSVAAFGEILRGGRHTGTFGYDDVLRIATAARGDDPYGYRSEFLNLVRAAKTAAALQPLRR